MKFTSHGVTVVASLRTHRYLVIAAVALAAVVAFLVFELVTAPRIQAVSPGPGAFLSDSTVRVSVDLSGADTLSHLSLRLDGKDMTAGVHVSSARLYLDSGRLDDGEHVVALRAQTSNLLRPTVHKTWRFVVDTVAPKIALLKPRRGAAVVTLPVELQGRTEPNAHLTAQVELDTSPRPSAVKIGTAKGILALPDDPPQSPASNGPDASPPGTSASSPPGSATDPGAATFASGSPASGATASPVASRSASSSPSPSAIAAPTTRASATADAAGAFSLPLTLPDGLTAVSITATDHAGNKTRSTTSFIVDVNPPELVVGGVPKVVKDSTPRVTVIATDQAGKPRVRVRLDGEVVYDKLFSGQYSLPVKTLAEGKHTLLVTATDPGQNVTTDDRGFLVNSTEKLGKVTLIAGAKGRDVRDLQKLLASQGYFKGKKTGVYDKATIKAVERLQESLGMTPDGVVGPQVLGALRGRIVIDQSEHRLYFYVNGKLKKTFSVATGQPAYPTPNGTFYVVWMTRNPTWTPPDSPWAAGATPIAPGPDNPVGMRWIGTSYPGVGIHGVPSSEDSSIGTYASHGCIRMHEWDVEQLFEWVTVGMPIVIRP